jgi:hypothetical protein
MVHGEEDLIMYLIAHSGVHRRSEDVRTRWWSIVLVGAFLALGAQHAVGETPDSTPRPASPALSVGFQNGLLSIEAKDEPWENVLDEVRAETGIFLRVSMPLEGSVTVAFRNLPVEQALRRLFGPDANFAILYPDQTPGPASAAIPSEVWVLGKASAASSNTPHGGQEVASSVQEGTHDSALALERELATNPQAALDAAVESRDQELRLKAIASLAQQANEGVVDVLLALAEAQEPPIRQSAREALEAMVLNEPQGRVIVTHMLETMATPAMRQWATETLGVSLEPLDDDPDGGETPEGDTAEERAK